MTFRDGLSVTLFLRLQPELDQAMGTQRASAFFFKMLMRLLMAAMLLFSFLAIIAFVVFEAIKAKSNLSSSSVHGSPLGRGPIFISLT